MEYKVIGVCGKKQSGKDTIAEYLVKEHGYVRYAFADPIKKACQEIFGFTDEQSWGSKKEDIDKFWDVAPRKIFQVFGTELFQYELQKHVPEFVKFGRTFWSQCFLRWYQIESTKNPNIKVVITDVRFPFESGIVKKLDGSIIKVTRYNPTEEYVDSHPSEVEMDSIKWDYFIENNSTIDELNIKVDGILKT